MYWKPVWRDARGRLRAAAGQRPPRQAGPRPQDRRLRRGVAVPARRGRACCRPSFVPPKPIRDAAQPDALSQDADRRAPARGQPAAQGARGHRHQARLRRDRHPRRLRPRDARRARRRARPTPRCSPTWRRAGCARRSRRCARRWRAASTACTRCWIGAILAHLDFLDEQIAGSPRRSRSRSPLSRQAVELLCTIPGVQRRTAEVIIAEIGVDMSVFPTAGHLASLGRASAPATTSPPASAAPAAPAKARKWLDWALEGSRDGRDPHQGHLPRALYRRQAAPRPRQSARRRQALDHLSPAGTCSAPASSTTTSAATTTAAATPNATTKRLVAQLERLGHTVTLQEATPRRAQAYFPVSQHHVSVHRSGRAFQRRGMSPHAITSYGCAGLCTLIE